MKKLIGLILVFAICLGLCACGSIPGATEPKASDPSATEPEEKDPAAELYGEWEFEVDTIDYINEGLQSNLDGFAVDSKLPLLVTCEFKESGAFKFSMIIDEDDIDDFVDDLADDLEDYMYDTAASRGVSEKEFDEAFEAEYNMTVKEYCENRAEEFRAIADDEFVNKASLYFSFDGEKIEITNSLGKTLCTMEVTLNNDELVITDVTGDIDDFFEKMEQLEVDFPMEFEKK